MHHCQTPWLLDISVPVSSLEIKSHLIGEPRARTACVREWTLRGTFLYSNTMQPPWQPLIMLQFSKEPLNVLMLITLLVSCDWVSPLSSAAPAHATHGIFSSCLSPAITEAHAALSPGHLTFLPHPCAVLLKLNVAVEMVSAFVTDTMKTGFPCCPKVGCLLCQLL